LAGKTRALENLAVSEFWRGKKVLLTGDTGFKGSWLGLWLNDLGARVHGCALEPDTTPSLSEQLNLSELIDGCILDIRDECALAARVRSLAPDIVFHLAAQPLVRLSYDQPLETFLTNVMGTAHLLNAARGLTNPCAIVVVATDKVYENLESGRAYRESDSLGGHDPYSASKAATEIVVSSWRSSFFSGDAPVRVASARAGNVIGGGDWAQDRLVPDIVRALSSGLPVQVRNPGSVRPWQHVLDPLSGYMTLAERLFTSPDSAYQDAFNFGPDPRETRPVRDLVSESLELWGGEWQDATDPDAPHEASLLNLNIDKARDILGWSPRWTFSRAVERTMNWYKQHQNGGSARGLVREDIRQFSKT